MANIDLGFTVKASEIASALAVLLARDGLPLMSHNPKAPAGYRNQIVGAKWAGSALHDDGTAKVYVETDKGEEFILYIHRA